MIQMKRASEADRETIRRLWAAEFGDGNDFIDGFCAWCTLEQVFLLWDDGTPRTMIAAPLVDVTLPGGGSARAGYLYALTTDRAARGAGFGRMMLHYADFCLQNQGADCAVLVPAEASLFRFFGPVGFVPAFSLVRREVGAEELSAPPMGALRPVGPEEYRAIQEERLADAAHMVSPLGLLTQQKALCLGGGGDLYALDLPGGRGCACAEVRPDGTALVRELLAPGDPLAALSVLHSVLDAPAYTLRLPAGEAGEEWPFGAVKWYRPESARQWAGLEKGYLGLALD